MDKIMYHKLVRDRIPQIIRAGGNDCETRRLEDGEYLQALEEKLTEEQIKYLRERTRRVMTEKTEYYSRLMGLRPEKIRVSSAKSRFGSCSSKGTVSYSLYLMLYPEEAFDLVAVHELCHLRYMNHSKDFYALLQKYLPDHKERKKLLSPVYRKSIDEIKNK